MNDTRQDSNYEYVHYGDAMGEYLRRKWDFEEDDDKYMPYEREDGTVIGATT